MRIGDVVVPDSLSEIPLEQHSTGTDSKTAAVKETAQPLLEPPACRVPERITQVHFEDPPVPVSRTRRIDQPVERIGEGEAEAAGQSFKLHRPLVVDRSGPALPAPDVDDLLPGVCKITQARDLTEKLVFLPMLELRVEAPHPIENLLPDHRLADLDPARPGHGPEGGLRSGGGLRPAVRAWGGKPTFP